MGNESGRNSAERPAFHFPPMNDVRRPTIRFHVVACLTDGRRVNIGATASRPDAESLVRLICPNSGIRVEIVGPTESG